MMGTKKILSAVLLVFLLLVSNISFVMAAGEVEGDRIPFESDVPSDLPRNYGSEDDIIANSTLVKVVSVKVDDFDLVTGRPTRETFERGDLIDIKVKLEAAVKVEDGVVVAWIAGDRHSPLVEASEPFTLRPDAESDETQRKTIDLQIKIPSNLDIDDGNYQLHIMVSARDNTVAVYNFPLRIEAKSSQVIIEDITVSPSQQVMAGRGFSVVARIENLGECDEKGVKISVSVPELGLSVKNADYIDTLENGDDASSPDVYMRVPENAKPGLYDLVVEVEYDDGYKTETGVMQIEVVNPGYESPAQQADSKTGEGKTIVQVGPEMQEVVKGQGGAIYPLTLTNEGSESKTYIIGVSGTEPFAAMQISPSNVVVVEPSESESVYVYISAREDAQVGAHAFTVDIKSADKVLQQIPLTANVVEDADSTAKNVDGLKRGLEIGLIILIIVLVVLGLVIAFTRAKKDNEEEPLAGQTYY